MEIGLWVVESTNYMLRYINGVYDKIPESWDNGEFCTKFWEVEGYPVDQNWARAVEKRTMLNDANIARMAYHIPTHDPDWHVVGTEDSVWKNWDGTCTPTSIRTYRDRAGLTQKALADSAGINLRQVQKLESGEIKPENLTLKNALALAAALGVEPKDLI